MGDRAEQLQLALDADLGTMTTTGDVLGIYAESAGRTATTTMGNVAGELGLDGDTAARAATAWAPVWGAL